MNWVTSKKFFLEKKIVEFRKNTIQLILMNDFE